MRRIFFASIRIRRCGRANAFTWRNSISPPYWKLYRNPWRKKKCKLWREKRDLEILKADVPVFQVSRRSFHVKKLIRKTRNFKLKNNSTEIFPTITLYDMIPLKYNFILLPLAGVQKIWTEYEFKFAIRSVECRYYLSEKKKKYLPTNLPTTVNFNSSLIRHPLRKRFSINHKLAYFSQRNLIFAAIFPL